MRNIIRTLLDKRAGISRAGISEKNYAPTELPQKLQPHNIFLVDTEENKANSSLNRKLPSLSLTDEALYEIFELIRGQHPGPLDAPHKRVQYTQSQQVVAGDFNNKIHPFANKKYLPHTDNRKETPLPGESTLEVQEELIRQNKLRFQRKLGVGNSATPRPRPF